VPEYVIANVPDVVIGLPAILKMLGTVAATLVTEPLAAADASKVTTPALFSQYSFMSLMFRDSSPGARFAANGTAAAVVL
jgi:hypothetical protein